MAEETSKPAQTAVRDELARIQARLGPMRAAAPTSQGPTGETEGTSPEHPEPQSLARALAEAAGFAHGAESRHDELVAIQEKLDTPEAAAAFASRFNLGVRLEARKAASLSALDLPALLVVGAGTVRLLTGRRGDRFEARAESRTYQIELAELEREEVGSVFLIQAKGDSVGREEADAAEVEKLVEAAHPARGVLRYMLTHQRHLVMQLLLSAAFSNVMLLALPIYTGLVYDRVIPHSAFDTLWAVSLGVTLALLSDVAMRSVRLRVQDALSSQASAAIQAAIVRSLLHLRMSDAPRSSAGVSMRLRELDGLTQTVPMFLAGVLIDAPFLFVVFALIWVNGGAVVAAPIFGLIAMTAVHYASTHVARAEQTRSTRLAQAQTDRLTESVEALEAVKMARAERKILGRFEKIYDEYAFTLHVSRLWQGLAAYTNMTIGQFMIVLVMTIGVYEVSVGDATLGGLSACSLLVGRIIGPISQLILVVHRMHQSHETLRALGAGLAGQPETTGDASGLLGAPPTGALRVDNVSFAYSGQNSPQLEGVSFSVKPGERIAIIGRSGSGKSTLLKLLVRLFEPDRGSILIDDVDARQYSPELLRGVLGLATQSPGLMDDSLLANLTLGLHVVTPSRVDAVAKLTGVADFAARHPKGYAMPVGSRGERLSGGERQSVALARLLIADPKVILLDEPTAAMDTMLEARFVRDFKAHLTGRTLIVATHRAPILELVDRLIWLDNVRIVADGPKADVLRRMSGAAA